MNSVRISICLFVLFPSNFASASLKLSELPPSDDETPSAKHPIDPSGIDQHYAIIMQLQSGINLLAMELESIKHRLNHTKADSNRHQVSDTPRVIVELGSIEVRRSYVSSPRFAFPSSVRIGSKD